MSGNRRRGILILLLCGILAPSAVAQGDDRVTFYRALLAFPGGGVDFGLRDILLMDGDRQVVTDARVPIDCYGGNCYVNIARVFDGNPETMLDKRASGVTLQVRPLFGLTGTHLVVRADDASKLAGVTLELQDVKWRTLFRMDLGDLARHGKAKAWRVGLKSKEIGTFSRIPAYVPYAELDPRQYVKSRAYDFRGGCGLEDFAGTAKDGAWVVRDGGAFVDSGHSGQMLRRKGEHGTLRLKAGGLGPGESLAVTFDHGEIVWPTGYAYGVKLGSHRFLLSDYEILTVPGGDRYDVVRNNDRGPLRLTLVLTRGSGTRAEAVDWKVCGVRHDCEGTATLDGASGVLPVELFVDHEWKWRPEPHEKDAITRAKVAFVGLGRAARPWPRLAKAHRHVDIELPHVYCRSDLVRWELKQKGIAYPNLILEKAYGPMTGGELALFKKALALHPAPKSNRRNTIKFGGFQAAKGIYYVLQLSDDPEIRETLERWCDSVLAYRNGGKHGRVHYVPIYTSNPGLKPCEDLPIWPHFMSSVYAEGKRHYKGDLSSGCFGPAIFALYADYVSAHPAIWREKAASGGMTCLEKAKRLVRDAELTLDRFTFKYFVDPVTGHVEKPWNRYEEMIEGCILLEETYDRLKGEKEFYSRKRRDQYRRVVEGFLEYFFDPEENYTKQFIKKDGRTIAVMTYRYAPKHLGWGSASESMGYASLDFAALQDACQSGRYARILTDDRALTIANTLRYRVFRGRDEKGGLILGGNMLGGNAKPGNFAPTHLWVSLVDPGFYDLFIRDAMKGTDRREQNLNLGTYGALLWLRHQLHKRGYGEPAARRAPKARIAAGDFVVGPPYQVSLRADTSDRIILYEWDVTGDGLVDHRGPEIRHTFPGPGMHTVVLRVTDKDGLRALDQAVVSATLLAKGTGAGRIRGYCWTGIGGSDLKTLTSSAKYPRSPDHVFEAESLQLPKSFGNSYGTMMEGYLHPPVDGDYTFYIAADDCAEFWLSPDRDPEGAAVTARTGVWCDVRQWDRHPDQQSKPVRLEKSKTYYFRVLHKEGSGGDHVAVAWRVAGMTAPEVIDGDYLSPRAKP
jgi:hypothetical protein